MRLGLAATIALLAALPSIARAGAPATLVGTVEERGTRRPIALARVALAREGAPPDSAPLAEGETDDNGRFTLELPVDKEARFTIAIAAPGWKPQAFTETLAPSTRLAVTYRLDPDRYRRYESVVRASATREEVNRLVVGGPEVTEVAGTHGDALRAITNLPGVARAPADSGLLVVWGSSPTDTAVYVGGHYIPQLFHFGGLTSVFNSDLLGAIDFMPGNFGVRYGRATGGTIDLAPRAGATDGYHGYAKLDFIDVGALVEGPVGKGSFAVAARRSLIDVILPIAERWTGNLGFTVAPRYYDYQAMLDYPIAGGKLKLMVYGSDDELSLVLKDAPDQDPALRGRFDTHIWFHALNATYTRDVGPVSLLASTSLGPQHSDLGFGQDVGYSLDVFEWDTRLEARARVARRAVVVAGVDVVTDWYQVHVRAPQFVATEADQQPPIASSKIADITEGAWEWAPGVYVEGRFGLTDALTVTPGLRIDGHSQQRATVDPRFTARYVLAPRWTLVGGVGLFHEATPAPYADPLLGNPALVPEGALHVSLGLEATPVAAWPGLHLRLVGFYKELWDLAVSSDKLVQRNNQVVPELYSDEGIGRIAGLEVLVRQEVSKYFFGWIAYTLSTSQRRDHPGEPWRPFIFDQTHVLTVVGTARLPWEIDAGLRFRYVTGNPQTPYMGGAFVSDADTYIPVPGPAFSTRDPAFVQLDLRVDKKLRFNTWMMEIYVDVTNATNHGNVEGYAWSYDFTKRVAVTGIPILPSLGLKASF